MLQPDCSMLRVDTLVTTMKISVRIGLTCIDACCMHTGKLQTGASQDFGNDNTFNFVLSQFEVVHNTSGRRTILPEAPTPCAYSASKRTRELLHHRRFMSILQYGIMKRAPVIYWSRICRQRRGPKPHLRRLCEQSLRVSWPSARALPMKQLPLQLRLLGRVSAGRFSIVVY